MKDFEKLRELADWFDSNYPPIHSPAHVKEVQFDLRRIACNLEKMDPEYTPKKYVYFVSYGYMAETGDTTFECSNSLEIAFDKPITGITELREKCKRMAERNGLKIAWPLNYQLLRTE